MEFVSWDDDIPNIWKNKIHVPNHQSEYILSSGSSNIVQKHCPYHICAITEPKIIGHGVLTSNRGRPVDLCKAYGLMGIYIITADSCLNVYTLRKSNVTIEYN